VGALAAGAAVLGAGGYAYHEHEKHKKERAEEEVSSLLHFFLITRSPYPPSIRNAPRSKVLTIHLASGRWVRLRQVLPFLVPEATPITNMINTRRKGPTTK
jgi:hypothetical protein